MLTKPPPFAAVFLFSGKAAAPADGDSRSNRFSPLSSYALGQSAGAGIFGLRFRGRGTLLSKS